MSVALAFGFGGTEEVAACFVLTFASFGVFGSFTEGFPKKKQDDSFEVSDLKKGVILEVLEKM